jgi:hypothetical protein
LPKVNGHLEGARLVSAGAMIERIWFLPEEEPPRFAPCVARRWHSGQLLFEELPFETDAEDAVRRAFEEGRAIHDVRAVPPSLRAAYVFAHVEAAAAALAIATSPLEVRGAIAEIAAGGRAAAETVVRRVDDERRAAAEAAARRIEAAARRVEEERRSTERMSRSPAATGSGGPSSPPESTTNARVEAALRATGAELMALRRLAGNLLEVRYRFMDERFTTIIDGDTLRVVDAGVCLDGEDALVTLESLPGVIREAIEDGHLVITRRHA